MGQRRSSSEAVAGPKDVSELPLVDRFQFVDRQLVVRNLDGFVWKPNQPEHSMWIWVTGAAIETFTVTRADVVQL